MDGVLESLNFLDKKCSSGQFRLSFLSRPLSSATICMITRTRASSNHGSTLRSVYREIRIFDNFSHTRMPMISPMLSNPSPTWNFHGNRTLTAETEVGTVSDKRNVASSILFPIHDAHAKTRNDPIETLAEINSRGRPSGDFL